MSNILLIRLMLPLVHNLLTWIHHLSIIHNKSITKLIFYFCFGCLHVCRSTVVLSGLYYQWLLKVTILRQRHRHLILIQVKTPQNISTLGAAHGARLHVPLLKPMRMQMPLMRRIIQSRNQALIFVEGLTRRRMIHRTLMIVRLHWFWIGQIEAVVFGWADGLNIHLTVLTLCDGLSFDVRSSIQIRLCLLVLNRYRTVVDMRALLDQSLQVFDAVCTASLDQFVFLVELLAWGWLEEGFVATRQARFAPITIAGIVALLTCHYHCLVRQNFLGLVWFFLWGVDVGWGGVVAGEAAHDLLDCRLIVS